jgi:hypothetical protein
MRTAEEGERWDLNPRPLEPQSSALPAELRPPQKTAISLQMTAQYTNNLCAQSTPPARENHSPHPYVIMSKKRWQMTRYHRPGQAHNRNVITPRYAPDRIPYATLHIYS